MGGEQLSKKHYQAIARAIHEARKDTAPTNASPQRELWIEGAIVRNIANTLQADNPRFDRARFIEACETGRCRGMRG